MTAARVRRFAHNTVGRDFIIGDIHGHFARLQAALDAVGFNPAAGDRLFSVGDLVDRGPESDKALEWLAKPWFFAVQGNHEDMAIRWPNGHMDPGNYAKNGGAWNIGNTPDVQREFSEAFAALPVAIEIETAAGLVGIVHAECPVPCWQDFISALETGFVRFADGSLQLKRREVEYLIDAAQWSRGRIEAMDITPVSGVLAVVVGHTPINGPLALGNTIYIDTGGWLPVHHGGHFTLLDVSALPDLV